MSLQVTVLGCGASAGVPMVGCECKVCTSENVKNKRLRASIVIQKGATRLLVDASPDLRTQTLRAGFKTIDALFITHAHADHCHGIDDIRAFNHHAGRALPVYSDAQTLDELQQRFAYVFQPPPAQAWYRAALTPQVIAVDPQQPIHIGEMTLRPFRQIHGKTQSIGIRIDNFAYSTDVNNLPEESLQTLENIDIWLVDCLGYREAPTHAHLERTLSWIERVKPKRAILTHMGHQFDYATLKSELPASIEPAYDGMVFVI